MQMDEQDLVRMNGVLRHRLRNMAAGIKGAMDVLAEEAAPHLRPEDREYFPLIERECQALSDLTTRMNLLFEELPPAHPATVGDLLHRLALELEPLTKQIPITYEADDDVRSAEVEAEEWVRAALKEVLVNALESEPRNGVSMKAERSDGVLRFTVVGEASTLPVESVEGIFLPFQTTKARHVGLGLSISKRLFERLGGSIEASLRSESPDLEVCMELPDHEP